MKTSILETSGNGFAKMVCIAKITFDVPRAVFSLLFVFSAISPYDCSKIGFKMNKIGLPRRE